MFPVVNFPFEVRVLLATYIMPSRNEILARHQVLDEWAHAHLDWLSIATSPEAQREKHRQNARIAAAVALVPSLLLDQYYDHASFLEFLHYQSPAYMRVQLPDGANIARFWALINWFHDATQTVSVAYCCAETDLPRTVPDYDNGW